MSYLAIVEVSGHKTGSELELETRADEAKEAVRDLALRGLQPSLPEASVVWVEVTKVERAWNGRVCSGHHVTVAIEVPEPLDQGGERDERWLRFWIESEVSVALLELINPITVEEVSVTPTSGGNSEWR